MKADNIITRDRLSPLFYTSVKFIICLIAFVLVTYPISAEAGLLALWDFKDCEALDASGNGHDGLLLGNPDCTFGPCGMCLSLDGVDDVVDSIQNPGVFEFANQSVSFTARTKIMDNPDQGRVFIYVGRDQTFSDNAEIALGKLRSGDRDGRLYFYVAHHGHLSTVALSSLTGEELPKNTWIHVAGVLDYADDCVRLYVNGELQQETHELIDFDLTQGTRDFQITLGASPEQEGVQGGFHNGPLDEVRIYDHALSEAEVDMLYESCSSETNNCGDVDASGGVDIDDIVYLIEYVFQGGPDPICLESIGSY